MKILNVKQGSPEWLAERASSFCASEAPAMMGCSPHMTRTELLDLKMLGVEKQASHFLEELRQKGHDAEATARSLVEDAIGDDLYPITVVREIDDMRLLASSDGATITYTLGLEHKLWNKEIVESVRAFRAGTGDLLPRLYWQLEHQILVIGLEEIEFVCSDGTRDNFVSCRYKPVAGRAEALLRGWAQFEEDLAAHQPMSDAPKVTGAAIEALPSLVMRLRGDVIESNLDVLKEKALAFIETINTDLVTDQDFADADNAVKFCERAEKALEAAKAQALNDTAAIAKAFATVDVLKEALRAKRLTMSKLIEDRKRGVRLEIINEAKEAADVHLRTLHTRTATRFDSPPVDFAAVIKGKKTVASVRNAVATELARWKIAASEVADRVSVNREQFEQMLQGEHERGHFADLSALLVKDGEAFSAIVSNRLGTLRNAEMERVARIEREAHARVQAEAAHRAIQQQEPEQQKLPIVEPRAGEVTVLPRERGMPDSLRTWAAQRGGRIEFVVNDLDAIPRRFFHLDEASVLATLTRGESIPGVRIVHPVAQVAA